MKELSKELKDFIEKSTWTYAKTYATTWPHEYIVQEKVDDQLFSNGGDYIVA
jgi:GTPase Era involved in 16S rRNA processing